MRGVPLFDEWGAFIVLNDAVGAFIFLFLDVFLKGMHTTKGTLQTIG